MKKLEMVKKQIKQIHQELDGVVAVQRLEGVKYLVSDIRKDLDAIADASDKIQGRRTQFEERRRLGLHTLQEAALAASTSLQAILFAVRSGTIPAPSQKLGGGARNYFDKSDVKLIKKAFAEKRKTSRADRRRADGFYSRLDVARACGVSALTIAYHESQGRWAAPNQRVPGFGGRFYTVEEFLNIKKIMSSRQGFLVRGKRGKKVVN